MTQLPPNKREGDHDTFPTYQPHEYELDSEAPQQKKRKLEEDSDESLSRFKFIIENKRVKEKERRRHLSRSIDELRGIIPQAFQTEKPNQACIMALSVEYIRHLQQKILEIQEELAHSHYSGAFLHREDLYQPPERQQMRHNMPLPPTSKDFMRAPLRSMPPVNPDMVLPLRSLSETQQHGPVGPMMGSAMGGPYPFPNSGHFEAPSYQPEFYRGHTVGGDPNL